METGFSDKERKKLLASGVDPDRFSHEEQRDMKERILPAFKRLIEICGDDPSREGMGRTYKCHKTCLFQTFLKNLRHIFHMQRPLFLYALSLIHI